MAVPTVIIKHASATSGVTTYYYDWESIQINRKSDAKTSSVKIVLPNHFGKYGSIFNEQDAVTIYASRDVVNESNDVLISMIVQKYDIKITDNKEVITITGLDRTYKILNKLLYKYGSGVKYSDDIDAPETIADIIKYVTKDETYGGQGAINATVTDAGTGIQLTPTKKSSDIAGAAVFLPISLSLLDKTAYEWISEISKYPAYSIGGSGTYTSGRPYVFWVTESNAFRWKYPTDTTDASVTITDTAHRTLSASFGKSVFDVVNMVIYDCGQGPDGNAIKWYYYDVTTEYPELRMMFYPMTDIAKEVTQSEKREMDRVLAGAYDSSGYPDTYANYNAQATLPTWDTTEAPTSDSEYLGSFLANSRLGDGFKGECKRRADRRAAGITKVTGSLRWKGTWTTQGNNTYQLEQLLAITYIRFGMSGISMRIKGISHSIASRGWTTVIALEEDAPIIEE